MDVDVSAVEKGAEVVAGRSEPESLKKEDIAKVKHKTVSK